MRILVISAFCPHGRADSAGVLDVHHMIRHLSTRHDVTVVCQVTKEDEAGLETLTDMVEVVPVPGRAIGHGWRYAIRSGLTLVGPLPAIAALTESKALREVLERVLQSRTFDAAHFAFTQTMHLRDLLPDGLPAVVDESDLAFERRRRYAETLRNPLIRIPLLWDCRKLERYELTWLSRFDAVLLRTRREEELLRSRTELARTLVVPPWVDLSFRDDIPERPTGKTVLFFGALWRPVNEDAALWMGRKVFPLVKEHVPDARLALVGSRPSVAVRALASSDITVSGWVDSIAPFYRESPAVVAPLRAGSGIKGKVIQALGVGRPVVATPIGAEGIDATRDDGLFVATGAEAFAAAVASLLHSDDPARWYWAGRDYVDRTYSFEAGCHAWESLLEELAAGSVPCT